MAKYIEQVFGAAGLLAQQFPGYVPRPGQLQLVREIEAAISNAEHTIAEAPTGTGKSIAYLVPAIWHVTEGGAALVQARVPEERREDADEFDAGFDRDENGQPEPPRAIVVTANIALQEQLFSKDLPLLREVLPWPFTFALAKGRGNYLCVSGETRVITRDGTREIRTIAGSRQMLLDARGQWVESEVRAFGKAKLLRVDLRRGNARLTVHATADHRWFQKPAQDGAPIETTTGRLALGDRLACAWPIQIVKQIRPSPFGIAHGVVYGDGSIYGGSEAAPSRTAFVVLHGKKRELLKYFPGSHFKEQHLEGYAEDAVRVVDLPVFFKDRPALDEAPSYLYGWLAGYFGADGCVSKSGEATLSAARMEDIEFVQALCSRLGIRTGLPSTRMRVGINQTEPSAIHSIGFVASTLTPEFFVREHHRARCETPRRERGGRTFWTVEAVTTTEREEEVFCAVVPTTHSFTLEGNLLTGNCLDRFDDAVAEHILAPPTGYDAREQWGEIVRWGSTTKTGDLSELPFEPLPMLRTKFTTSADDCTGKACPRFEDCHAEKAKKLVAGARVVVTNYHLFFASLAMQKEFGKGLLPPADIVIMDEAHKAADVARDFFGFRFTAGSVRWACRLLTPPKTQGKKKSALPMLDAELKEKVLELADAFFAELLTLAQSEKYFARLTEPHASSTWQMLHAGLLDVKRCYEGAASTELLARDRKSEVRKAARKAGILAAQLKQAMLAPGSGEVDEGGTENAVFFLELYGRAPELKCALCSKLIDVAPVLQSELFEASTTRSAIITSATLATRDPKKGGFDWIQGELGAYDARELQTPSPFDFRRQALLVIPEGLPDPSARDFADRIAEHVLQAVEQARGRTLGLFTSYKGLEAAHALVKRRLGDRYLILRQGEAPRTQLIKRFRENVSSVLLGTESFWAGVDVPGESLSCVVIDRIPFETPNDPIVDAMSERLGKKYFKEIAIPRAAIKLRQGFGRLIRASGDRGCVVLLDRRLTDKPYGRLLLASLPETARSRSLQDVGRFLAHNDASLLRSPQGAPSQGQERASSRA